MAGVKKDLRTIMKKNKIPPALILVIFIYGVPILLGLLSGFFSFGSKNNNVSKADGFTINAFDVVLDVHENNVVDVTETIVVNWYESGHHGIYRYIPTWLEYTSQDGKTIKRKSSIKNLKTVGESYSVDNVSNDKIRIKIGSSSTTLPTGNHSYTIKYTYDMGSDPFNKFDEFIFHAYGDFWGTPINNASLTVNMPKEFDQRDVKFWADKKRSRDITSNVNYTVTGNILTAKMSRN